MNKVYVISDTHFGHKNICKYEPIHRPFSCIEEHDEALVKYWNEVVHPNDTVWHLGDVLFGHSAFETLGRLNGIKRLVMGNHDHYPAVEYMKHFRSIHGVAEVRGCVLTHMPINPSQFYRYKLNLHGHTHSTVLPDSRYVCVSVEQTNLRPVLLDQIIDQRLVQLRQGSI